MGSTFSVENDTNSVYWVTHYNCQAALWGSIAGLLAVSTAGIVGMSCILSFHNVVK